MPDDDLLRLVRERLSTAAIGDVMDLAGLTRQFLPPGLRPVQPGGGVLAGRAMPVLEVDCTEDEGRDAPFGVMLRALDELRPGEIYVAGAGSPETRLHYALWGGLMSARAASLGSPGVVLDGFHRDTGEILRLGFPVFSRGAYAQDQRLRGRVVDLRCPLAFPNGTVVRPGDLIVGDLDGVLAVPSEHAEDITRQALAKMEGEGGVLRAIEAGERTEAIFARTGVM